jgi:hypothetical protein
MMDSVIQWSPGLSLDAVEKLVILKAYSFFKKNKTATSQSLGISIRTLDSKLERYEQEDKIEKERQENEQAKRTEFLIKQRGNPPNHLGMPYSPIPQVQNPFAGVRMESIINTAQEHEMSMQKREEVQTLLPKQSASSHSKKNR